MASSCDAGEALPKKKKADRYFEGAEAAAEGPSVPAAEKPKVLVQKPFQAQNSTCSLQQVL